MNKKIQSKFFLTNHMMPGIIGVIIIIISGFAIGYFDFQKFQTKEIEKIKRNGMISANRFQTVMSSFYLAVKMMDDQIANNPDKDPRFDVEFNKMVQTYREHTGNKMYIRMVTPDGKLFYFPSKNAKPLADVRDREYYKAHLGRNIEGIYFAEPVLSRVTGKWGIPISYKVKAENDKIFILFGALEFSTIDDIFKDIGNNNDSTLLIAREDGKVLYRKPFDKNIVGKNKLEIMENSKEIDVEKNISILIKNGMERRLINYNKIEGFPIFTVISENYDTEIQKWRVGFFIKMAIMSVVIILFIVLNLRMIKLFKRLQESNETKDKFLALIAHDIKGPIGNGVLLMELTIEDKNNISNEVVFNRIVKVKDSMKNMYGLLENLLNWAILQKQQILFKPVNTNTEIILSECLEVLYPIAEMKKIKIIYENQETFPLFVDKQMMVTVFRNFILNSIKFTNENGVITIRVIKIGSKIEISVEDTGVGMEKERIEKLFDLYKKESTFGTKNEKGTGVGLILCKEFVEKHRGKIYVESEVGKGSIFKVVLPLKS